MTAKTKRVEVPLATLVAGWPRASQHVAEEMVVKYGQPHEASAWRLVWYYNSPWERTTVWREGELHNFPRSHVDILEQVTCLQVPLEAVTKLSSFHGSLSYQRTKGEISICCKSEAMNMLALNLAQEIAIGKLTVKEARSQFARLWRAHEWHWPDLRTQQLQVVLGDVGQRSERYQTDPDKPFS